MLLHERSTSPPKNELNLTPSGKYGSGSERTYIAIGTESIVAREETTAEEILTRLRSEMLNAILVTTYSRGSKGAPSQPVELTPVFKKQPAPFLRYKGSCENGMPFKFESNGRNKRTNIA
jgi:hypothetical protein